MNPVQHGARLVLRIYQIVVSPVLSSLFGPGGWGCRYHPTCSQYALEAIQEHGFVGGTFLTLRRLFRCHPWGGCGHDPVPRKKSCGGERALEPLARNATGLYSHGSVNPGKAVGSPTGGTAA